MAKIYTQKQIEKYKRQKYLSTLNKCTKNLYKLFKNPSTTYEDYKKRFSKLKEELDNQEAVYLESEYSRRTKEYIENLYNLTIKNKEFTTNDFLEIKDTQITKLNGLQKLKNRAKYNKEKHKAKIFEE